MHARTHILRLCWSGNTTYGIKCHARVPVHTLAFVAVLLLLLSAPHMTSAPGDAAAVVLLPLSPLRVLSSPNMTPAPGLKPARAMSCMAMASASNSMYLEGGRGVKAAGRLSPCTCTCFKQQGHHHAEPANTMPCALGHLYTVAGRFPLFACTQPTPTQGRVRSRARDGLRWPKLN